MRSRARAACTRCAARRTARVSPAFASAPSSPNWWRLVTEMQRRIAPFSVGLAVVLLALDATLPAWGFQRGWPLAGIGLLHAAVAGTAAAFVLRSHWRTDRHAVLLVLATAVLGPIGPAGVLLAMALEWYHARKAISIEEWHSTLFPPSGIDEQTQLWRRIGQRASDRSGDARVTP